MNQIVNVFANNYIEYENNGDKNKTLSIKKYFVEYKSYLKDIKNLKKIDIWKVQSKIAICLPKTLTESV